MNTKKIIGNVVAVAIVLIGVILIGAVQAATGLRSNHVGVLGALIIYSPLAASIFIARFVSKRIQGKGLERGPDDHVLEKTVNKKGSKKPQKDKAVHLGNFSVEIPEGNEPVNGYVNISHNTKYSIKLSNSGDRPCDTEVEVDGKLVGTWCHTIREKHCAGASRP